MHGVLKPARTAGQRRPRRQIRKGRRRAALQAIAAARLWLKLPIPASTQAEAAEMTGSNIAYLRAASILIQYGDAGFIALVETGRVPLLEAAARVQKRVELVRAYRNAEPEDRIWLGRAEGATAIFDAVVTPALS
jgi:hypothetical protein